jgi:hypothetical protein
MYFPHDRELPLPGTRLFRISQQLFVLRADANDRVLVVNSSAIGNIPSLVALAFVLLFAGFVTAYRAGSTVLRRYFTAERGAPIDVRDALRLGEGLGVEFKRSIAFDQQNSVDRVLETIAAFANTGDGTLFIGIEDNGRINGLSLDGLKARDAFLERLHQVVRRRIAPSPRIDVDFIEVNDRLVSRIFVPRGDEALYTLEGVTYMRDAAADIKASPERIVRMIKEFA